MKEKSTGELDRELMNSYSLDTYLSKHQDCFISHIVAE